MKTERCREWREDLGAYALGHLSGEEQARLEAHLDGCPAAGQRPTRSLRSPSDSPTLTPRDSARRQRRHRSWASGLPQRSAPSDARSAGIAACASVWD